MKQRFVAADRPDLPPDVARLLGQLREGLREILADDLVSLFAYGALAFPHPAEWRADVDFHVVVAQRLDDDDDRQRINAVHRGLDGELDGYYVTLADARRADPPPHQLACGSDSRDNAWALHRAHVLAGRYFSIAGDDPADILVPPTWDELVVGLRNETTFIRDHPEHFAFGVLNACRVRWSLEHHDVVVSKYVAAQWARTAYPGWSDAIDAALRSYCGGPQPGDRALLRRAWGEITDL